MNRLLLSFYFLLFLLSIATADDGAVMLKLANSLKPLPSGWSTTSSSDMCDWEGVNCDSSNTRVTSISLSRKGLTGTLPKEFSTLAQLQSLFLQNNKLSGDVPAFTNLSKLESVYLDSNNFTSIAPKCFQGLTSLKVLSIGSNNNLSPWELPVDLGESTSLTTLTASESNVVGALPDIFESLPSLQNLRLSYNNLTGSLPPSLANSSIQILWLNNQQMGLTGTIDVLSSMTQLSQVWVHENMFSGPIPDLSKCDHIFDLQLRDNQLTGIVPASLVSLPNLINVSLSNNKLQGPVPVFPSSVTIVIDDGTNNYCAKPGVPCDPQVTTLLEVAAAFGYPTNLVDGWEGNNACDGWSFVTCDLQGHVTTMSLGKQNFGGTISPAFGSLTYLTKLYINDNNLTGSIPESLTKLTRLQLIDVSNNNLSGKVPVFASSVQLTTTPGNPLLGTDLNTPGSSSGSGSTTESKLSGAVIVGIVIAVVICIFILSFVLYKYKKQRRKVMVKNNTGKALFQDGVMGGANANDGVVPAKLHRENNGGGHDNKIFEGANVSVSMEVLRDVTNDFSEQNIIGRGGFGVVFKGELHDGTKIAVKRMEFLAAGNKGLNEFQAEIAVLSKVRHRHLVSLLGYCVNGHDRLLVYEYMPQGTLAQHLFEDSEHGHPPLTWKQRVTIALDVARGVEYLHALAQESFIHRDLKPSNILLGDDMRAKVADFGLVKNAPDGRYSMETRLAGTFGYLAPEYAATGKVTTKVDVFAFGVILMEIITGRKALDDNMPDEMAHLVTWFRRILINKEKLLEAIDETLLDPDEETCAGIYKVAELAGHCTAREPHQRPDMGYAVNVLGPLVQQWRPADSQQQDEESFGIDLHISLPQALRRWQASEDSSSTYNDDASYLESSMFSKPSGCNDTFNSSDCR